MFHCLNRPPQFFTDFLVGFPFQDPSLKTLILLFRPDEIGTVRLLYGLLIILAFPSVDFIPVLLPILSLINRIVNLRSGCSKPQILARFL
jgi:hypothetical protein